MASGETRQIIELYPSLGHLAPSGRGWIVPVQGQVYASGKLTLRQRIVLGLLRPLMRASKADFQSPLFTERMRSFLGRPLREMPVRLRIGNRTRLLHLTTSRTGHFTTEVHISHDEAMDGQAAGGQGQRTVPMAAHIEGAEEEASQATALLLPPSGLSVITDIDDTIKHTGVVQRREMLANTFLRPFRAIPGMAEAYREWQKQGADFHYVSSSPWQLHMSLADFLTRCEFPAGSFHLRAFRLRDHMLQRLLLMRRTGKKRVIAALMKAFPRRQFVLVGDSAEKDPEIYAAMARAHPGQVVRMLIRNLAARPLSTRRQRKLRRRIDPSLLHLFQSADELGDLPEQEIVVGDLRR